MELVDCLCINCEEMVSPSHLSTHSNKCLNISAYLTKISNQDEVTQLDFKIEKLKNSMEDCVTSRYREEDSRYVYTFKQLILISTELLLCGKELEDARYCENIGIQILELGPFPNTNLYVYMERLKSLAEVRDIQDKANAILARRKKIEEFDVEEDRMNDVLFLRREMNYYKHRAFKLDQIIRNLLSGNITDKDQNPFETEPNPSTQNTEEEETHEIHEEETLPKECLAQLLPIRTLYSNTTFSTVALDGRLPSIYLVRYI